MEFSHPWQLYMLVIFNINRINATVVLSSVQCLVTVFVKFEKRKIAFETWNRVFNVGLFNDALVHFHSFIHFFNHFVHLEYSASSRKPLRGAPNSNTAKKSCSFNVRRLPSTMFIVQYLVFRFWSCIRVAVCLPMFPIKRRYIENNAGDKVLANREGQKGDRSRPRGTPQRMHCSAYREGTGKKGKDLVWMIGAHSIEEKATEFMKIDRSKAK